MKKKLLVLCLAVLMSLGVVAVYAQNGENYNQTESNYSMTVKCSFRGCSYRGYTWNGPAASASEAREAALAAAKMRHSKHADHLYVSN